MSLSDCVYATFPFVLDARVGYISCALILLLIVCRCTHERARGGRAHCAATVPTTAVPATTAATVAAAAAHSLSGKTRPLRTLP
jgi:hypothetical protein